MLWLAFVLCLLATDDAALCCVVEAIKDDACEERVFVEKEEFNGAAYEALEGVDTLRIVTESWLVFLCTIELPTDDPSVPTFPWGPDSESRLLQLLRDAMLLLAGPNESCDDRIFLNKDGEDGDNFSSDIALSNADCTSGAGLYRKVLLGICFKFDVF